MKRTTAPDPPNQATLGKRLGYWSLTFVALLIYKWWTIRLPASWDASWTVIPGGATLVENGFDLPALLNSPHFFELGPATHGNSPVTWLTAVVMLLAGRGDAFLPTLHIIHLAIGAVALRQVYVFGRSMWGPRASMALMALTAILPVMSAQLGFIYLEVPQLAVSMLAVNAFRSNHTGRAAAWGALATAVKVSGIIAPLALAATVVVLGRNRAAFRRGLAVSVPAIAVAGLGALYLATVTTTINRSASEVVRASIGSIFGTIDVALMAFIPLVFAYRTFRSAHLSPAERQALTLSIWMIVGFLCLYLLMPPLGFKYAMLSRYLVQIVPFALVAVALTGRVVFGRRASIIVGILIVSFALIGGAGRFYPRPALYNSVYQEHSLAYADILRLEQVGFAALERVNDIPILVLENQWFRGTYPEAGFVEEPLPNMQLISSVRELPDRFVLLDTEDIEEFETNQLIEILADDAGWTSQETEFSRGRFKIRLIEYSRR